MSLQEVDEPSPNFIVVYDLQSGTLFKKWKPSVNTVSLDISSKDGCVLSGLEDGRILVWDLITGKYINKLALNPHLTVLCTVVVKNVAQSSDKVKELQM